MSTLRVNIGWHVPGIFLRDQWTAVRNRSFLCRHTDGGQLEIVAPACHISPVQFVIKFDDCGRAVLADKPVLFCFFFQSLKCQSHCSFCSSASILQLRVCWWFWITDVLPVCLVSQFIPMKNGLLSLGKTAHLFLLHVLHSCVAALGLVMHSHVLCLCACKLFLVCFLHPYSPKSQCSANN